jgi:hypothetical protein
MYYNAIKINDESNVNIMRSVSRAEVLVNRRV